jgi:tetratricopeptide (TPR) repeat protein
LKKAIEINPKNPKAYYKLGLGYRAQGKFSQAEDSFKKAIEINPKNARAYVEFGMLYRSFGRFPQAEEVLKKALELFPTNRPAYFVLQCVYIDQGKLSQAEDCFTRVIKLYPDDDSLYVRLGWLYLEQNKFPEAEDCFKKALELHPGDPHLYNVLSMFYAKTRKPELAAKYARKATRSSARDLCPTTVSSYRELKKILDRKGIKLVCVQYPVLSAEPLRRIFGEEEGVIFVDNERTFKEAIEKESYRAYFRDMFANDFGHCTPKGNLLLAQNIAGVILKEVFRK